MPTLPPASGEATSPPHPDRSDHHTPLRIGRVRLNVRDLQRTAEFYENTLGLHRLGEGGNLMTLSTARHPLLELAGDPGLAPRDRRDAGLFHTAFLLPSRADLGRWPAFAVASGVPLQDASDHIVSEALYLTDPEGNGIEIHADRAPSRWRNAQGRIHMITAPMDRQGVLAAAGDSEWAGFPEDGFIGHVHLQVGDTHTAERFHHGVLGFDITSRLDGASFFGSGGYHHQMAGNVWNSRNAGTRPEGTTGLASVEIISRDPAIRKAIIARARASGSGPTTDGAASILVDPWGTCIVLAP